MSLLLAYIQQFEPVPPDVGHPFVNTVNRRLMCMGRRGR